MGRAVRIRSGKTLAVCTACLLAACASNEPAPVIDRSLESAPHASPSAPRGRRTPPAEPAAGEYRVVAGDTLYAIAFRHGLDYRELAAWNHIAPPYRIYVGQQLRLRAPEPGTAPSAAVAPPVVAENPHVDNAAKPPATPAPAAPSTAAPTDNAAPAATDKPAPRAVAAVPPAATQGATKPPANAAAAATERAPELNAGGVSWRWPAAGEVIGTFVAGDQTHQGIDIAGREGDPVVAAADGDVVYSGNGLIGYGDLIIIKHNANFLSAYGHNRKRLVQEGEHVKAGQRIAEMGASSAARDELHFEIRRNGKPVNPLDYLPAR